MSRYKRQITATNFTDRYKDVFEERGVKSIEQYRTPTLSDNQTEGLPVHEHIWGVGDNFWKLSTRFYGDPKYWYIIAKFNNTPTPSHVSIGDIIKIPIGLNIALRVVG